jgi:NADPH-dependent 2,4-dienoyl-CoA reductase/sulfur reductase-like enzyme
MAGMRTLEELLKSASDMYDITVFGDEPHPNYNRIMLSPVLAGEQTVEQIILNSRDWYAEHGIKLHTGKRVVKIDRKNRLVEADDGRGGKTIAPYDRLLLATGSKSFILPVPGADLPGVIGCRFWPLQACGSHRRRPARPGSGQRFEAARHGCFRGAYRALVAGTPDGRTGFTLVAEESGRKGPEISVAETDGGTGTGGERSRLRA